MHLHMLTILFVILDNINRVFTQGVPVSPCPKLFRYEFDGAEWHGMLSVQNPGAGKVLHIKVILSLRGKPTTNYLGEIELLTRGQYQSNAPVLYKVKFPNSHFPPKLLQITANGNVICVGAADHSIFVTQIQLEHTRKFTFIGADNTQLPQHTDFAPSTWLDVSDKTAKPLRTSTVHDVVHLPTSNTDRYDAKTSGTEIGCGIVDERLRVLRTTNKKSNVHSAATQLNSGAPVELPVVTTSDKLSDVLYNHAEIATDEDLIGDGDAIDVGNMGNLVRPSITRGSWPWLAAIYVNNLTSLAYQCGGTLITAHIVLTSAHCFHLFKARFIANEVLVFLGRHNLRNWSEEGSLAAPVDNIFVHPDFDADLNSYDADIAVVVLKYAVRFSIFIRPACLWSGATNIQYIEGESGTVVGWGLANIDTRIVSSIETTSVPRVIDVPIVSNDICFKTNPNLRSLSSNRTFCAGSVMRNVTSFLAKKYFELKSTFGPCTGDSGTGLMIYKNRRWFLRGILSVTLPTNNKQCSINQYVIYTDVAKFLDWILAFTI